MQLMKNTTQFIEEQNYTSPTRKFRVKYIIIQLMIESVLIWFLFGPQCEIMKQQQQRPHHKEATEVTFERFSIFASKKSNVQ